MLFLSHRVQMLLMLMLTLLLFSSLLCKAQQENNQFLEVPVQKQHPKSTIRKKSPQSFAHLMNWKKKKKRNEKKRKEKKRKGKKEKKNVPDVFDNHKILFWLSNKQIFHMFSPLDPKFCALFRWSRRRAKDHGRFYLNYPQNNGQKIRSRDI